MDAKKDGRRGVFKQVRETRILFQDWMGPRFTEIVEDATGRKVRAFFSQVTHDPDIAVELFFFEPLQTPSDGGPPAWQKRARRGKILTTAG